MSFLDGLFGIGSFPKDAGLLKSGESEAMGVSCPHCGHEGPIKWAGLINVKIVLQTVAKCSNCGRSVNIRRNEISIPVETWVIFRPKK